MRRFSILAVLLLATAARAELLDGINVIVNESIITYDEVERQLEPNARTLAMTYPNDIAAFQAAMSSNRTDIVRGRVEGKLILDEFKSKMNGGDLPESILDDEIRTELRKNFNGDRALMTKTLREKGITSEMYRDQIRERIIVEYMQQKQISYDKIIISPAKIESFYASHGDQFKVSDQVKLRMITLPKPADSPEAARKIAEEIVRKVDAGAPFSEMASIYSAGAERAKGGDRGWVGRDDHLRKELEQAMFSLKAGQHSEIIDLPESVHILYVEEVKPEHVKPLADVRDEIQQKLRIDERRRLYERWVARLKNKAFVRYVD
ncbi:MAG: surA [Verrucomicrobiales bacterium]|nr:surA [Verrucomicrobiales bacterium]